MVHGDDWKRGHEKTLREKNNKNAKKDKCKVNRNTPHKRCFKFSNASKNL